MSRLTSVREPVRTVELACTSLTVVLLVAFAADAFYLLPATTWVLLLISGALAVSTFIGASFDGGRVLFTGESSIDRRLCTLAVALPAGVLAVLTLFWVGVTLWVLAAPPERGGVLFGPLLALFTAGPLAVLVLLREGARRLV